MFKFTSREEKLIYILSKFNCVSVDNIRNYCIASNKAIGHKRLKQLEKMKFIEKITIVEKDLTETQTYILGKKGIEEAKDRYNSYYKSNSPIHDLKHSNYIFKNFSNEDLKYYKHEKELPPGERGASRSDGAFIYSDNSIILVETYTRNYTQERKEAKLRYADQLGCDMLINIA